MYFMCEIIHYCRMIERHSNTFTYITAIPHSHCYCVVDASLTTDCSVNDGGSLYTLANVSATRRGNMSVFSPYTYRQERSSQHDLILHSTLRFVMCTGIASCNTHQTWRINQTIVSLMSYSVDVFPLLRAF